MSNKNLIKSNSSSTNFKIRSKKLPPPPLCLPASNTTTDEVQQYEQKHSTNNCCSSLKECSHEYTPYVLAICRRPQILETLINSSSTLLVPPISETKQRKSQTSINSNQIKQRQAFKPSAVADAEWLDFIRLIIYKPLENEIKMLLDKYKMTYFDRVNAPNANDAAIRASLCDMVSETLATYSSSSSMVTDNTPTNIPSSTITTNSNSKRKRESTSTDTSDPSSKIKNNQTKFVISHIIPGKCDNTTNSNKMIYQQRYKQFQKKYSHLFNYVPDKDEQSYLIHEGHLTTNAISSSRSSNNNICLMLYDEVLTCMEEYDLELSGISIDNSFTLPASIIEHIHSSIQ